ncbi:MAG TPA: hypothetical protein VI485_01730 [Vicinamibacterales bacterium]|nr:hypothetical protein [Vicinamibacterales bacterium]
MPYPPPNVTSVSCGQQASQPTFSATWNTTNYPATQQFVVGILDATSGTIVTVGTPVMGALGSVTASQALLQSDTYQIVVATYDGGAPGLWPTSGPMALFTSPTNLAITYNGTNIGASWQDPAAGTTPLGGRVTIQIGISQWVFDLSGTQGTFVPAGVPFSPSQPATVTVSGLYGASLGPPSTSVALVQAASALTLVDYSGQSPLTLAAQGFAAGTARTFNVVVSSRGVPLQATSAQENATTGQMQVSLTATLNPGASYELAVQQTVTGSTGPLGPPAPIVLSPPVVLNASYAGGVLTYATVLPGGQPVSGLQIAITGPPGTTVTTVITSSAIGSIPAALGTTTSYTASFRAAIGITAGVSLGPAAALTPAVLTVAPAVSAITYNGTSVEVTYSASTQTGVTAYQIEAVSGGAAIASAQFSGTTGWLPLAGFPGVPYNVQVRAVGVSTSGPAGSPVAVPLAPVAITSAGTSAVTGTTTLQWSGPAGATYTLQLFGNGVPLGNPTTGLTATSYNLPSSLPTGTTVTAAVAAVTSAGAVTATGPFGAPYPVPTLQPEGVGIAYDGVTLTVSWRRVPAASGYLVSVIATGATSALATAPVKSGSITSATVPAFATTASSVYNVFVQARVGADLAPSAPPVPLFTPGLYPGSNTAAAPNLVPASSLAFASSDITLYLPDIGAGTPLQNLPITQAPFTLQANPDSATKGAYPYMLVIPGTSAAWTFTGAAGIRSIVQNAYVQFLTSVEQSNATPWGIAVLQQAISRAMPQTFQETLYYAYGLTLANSGTTLTPASWCADLRPGMILRVVVNDYLNVGQVSPSPWINGYVGGSVIDYDVGSYLSTSLPAARQWTLGFDALLARLAASGSISVTAPQGSPANETQSGVADAIDLLYPAFPQPFYRLFFPGNVMTPSGIGTTFTPSNFVVAAAASFATLQSAVNYPTATTAVAYFRGRAVIKVCIRVTVNGVEEVVPIGTTVGNILERYAAQLPSAPVQFAGVQLSRALGLAITQPTSPVSASARLPVRLDWNRLSVYGPANDALTLPLLHGDRLSIG